jgi:gluconate 2-dehydrogenase gamma chain
MEDPMSESEQEDVVMREGQGGGRQVSRRQFLKGSGAAVASAGAAAVSTAVVIDQRSTKAQDSTPASNVPEHGQMPGIGTDERPIQFFNIHEAETVDALVSRILPGDENDPGAREAGVVFYIDGQLAGTNLGFTLKTYTQGPFPVVSEQSVPVEAASARDIYEYVPVPQDQITRYGFQSVMTPQEIYRSGIGYVDNYAQSKFKADFVDLDADQQDQILTDMENGEATGFEGPSAAAFFTRLRNDTIEGMFSDPMYGGNRDMVGWKLIGYPGAQRNYTPDDLKNTSFRREPQSLAQLMAKEGH